MEEEPKEMEPRLYQSEIENICVEKNTIIYLPTGAGKTYITIRIIKRLQHATQKKFSEGGQRTFFLVNTIPLVSQHIKTIKQLTPMTAKGISSHDRVDIWNEKEWNDVLENHQVFVMTSQILLDMILHGYIQVNQINLLIFDECHAAVDNHPMRQIMDRVNKANLGESIRIIGLTATLLNKTIKPSEVESAIESLEKTFNSTICTAENWDEVISVSANPSEIILGYNEYSLEGRMNELVVEELTKISSVFMNIFLIEDKVTSPKIDSNDFHCISSGKKTMKKISNLHKTVLRMHKEFGLFGLSITLLTTIVKLERLKLKATMEVRTVLQYFITSATKIRGLVETYMSSDVGYNKIIKHSSNKVLSLLNILLDYSADAINSQKDKKINKLNEELCCIIFVKERSTSLTLYVLMKIVRNLCHNFSFLKHDFITGFNVNPFSDTREDLYEKKKNMETVVKFRTGILNCLISTAILEEGFDLPSCNLIIHFDDLVTFRSYIQSKGRGRLDTASFVMMIPTLNKEKFSRTYAEFDSVLKTLNEILVGKSKKRLSPTTEDVSNSFKYFSEPYKHGDAWITQNSSISLLNRYCSTLPHDIYTISSPLWYYKKLDDGTCKVTATLPVNSIMKKNFKSPPMNNIKMAKQVTALAICKELHRLGELNDKLLPVTREEVILSEKNHKLFFAHWDKYNEEIWGPDIEKAPNAYQKKFPYCLRGIPEDEIRDTFYMYIINIHPINIPNQDIKKILDSKDNFGILTYRKLEKICPFSLFLSSGEVLISIEFHETIHLKPTELSHVKGFHLMLFDEIIGLNQQFVMYSQSCENNHLFVVPIVSDTFSINWDVMINNTSIEQFGEPSIDERKELSVTKETYLHTIVNPWYRGDSSCRYIVSHVDETMSPASYFPTSNFATFADYFYEKYKLKILGSNDQPLLRVNHIGGKMNCLLPRAISLSSDDNISRRKIKSTMFANTLEASNYDELLIPEYCFKYSFPGIYWFKSSLIPSVIHRLSMLLQAEELRQKISSEIDINYTPLPDDFKWDNLAVDIHALRSSHQKILSDDIPRSIDNVAEEDETMITTPSTFKLNRVQVSYEISKKNLDQEYPWTPDQEPVDIYKNADEIKLIDIECYEKFVNDKINQPSVSNLKCTANEGPNKKFYARAICPPPLKYNDVIGVIQRTPSIHGPTIHQILAAITTSKCNDVFNLERYETLGDSFLKFASSLFLWHTFPQYNEGQLTALKGKIVSNRNLFYCGSLFNLGGKMNIKQFSAKCDWIPPSFCIPKYIYDNINQEKVNPSTLNAIELPKEEMLSGKLSSTTIKKIDEMFEKYALSDTKYDYSITESYMGRQSLGNKSIADSVEALIGVYLLDSGIDAGFKILKWLKILPLKDEREYKNYLTIKVDSPLKLGLTNVRNVNYQLNYLTSEIEKIIGYKFQDPSFLLEALSHSSNIRNNITGCYQRLEFIGDAILDFLITSYIYENCGSLSPGDITDLRSALVNNVTFACIVVRLGLQKFILTANNELDKAMQRFIQYQEDRGHIIDETVVFLLDEGDCHIADYVDVPKTLGDVFESIAGAIFFDSGNDLNTVWRVFYRFMHAEIEAFSCSIPKQPVRLLYEKIHAQPKFLSSVVTNDGSRVMVPLRINSNGKHEYVHGFGINRKNAKRSAAKVALKILGS